MNSDSAGQARRGVQPLELDALLGFALELAAPVALGNCAALVVDLLAATDPELELGSPVPDVEAQGDDGQALGLGAPDQLGDLVLVQEELSRPARLVVVAIALLVWRDVGADQPGLAPLDARIGIHQVHAA